MSDTDWTILDGSLDKSVLDRGNATTVLDPDGNKTCYGLSSRVVAEGAGGLFCSAPDLFGGDSKFTPTQSDSGDPRGGRIQGLIQRGPSGSPTSFAPMFFIGLQGPSVDDEGYLLGLSDSNPHFIVLRKGKISEGIPNSDVGTDGVLAKGSEAFPPEKWHQLRLDAVLNENGDVTIICRQSDVDVQGMENPLWTHIPGIGEATIDDVLGVRSGTVPFAQGRMGFALQVSDVARRAFFTRINLYRQI